MIGSAAVHTVTDINAFREMDATNGLNVMPTGPQGQKRLGDVISCTIHVVQNATGKAEDEIKVSGRGGGKAAGSDARVAKLALETEAKIASEAAKARWVVKECVA